MSSISKLPVNTGIRTSNTPGHSTRGSYSFQSPSLTWRENFIPCESSTVQVRGAELLKASPPADAASDAASVAPSTAGSTAAASSSAGVTKVQVVLAVVICVAVVAAVSTTVAVTQVMKNSSSAPANVSSPKTSTVFLSGALVVTSWNYSQDMLTTYKTDLCSNLTTILSYGGLAAVGCTILQISPGSVKARYQMEITQLGLKPGNVTVAQASMMLVKYIGTAPFTVDPSSMTFDGSDCNPNYQYKCANGQCINYQTWCNGVFDCSDKSDEPAGCRTSNFTFQSCPKEAVQFCQQLGACIFQIQRCDNYQDCPDDSDETGCNTCADYQYQCPDGGGKKGQCIYMDWLCDGIKDCPGGDDESLDVCNIECASASPFSGFVCISSDSCIRSSSVCNGVADCPDGSDEKNCITFDGSSVVTVNFGQDSTSKYYLCADDWQPDWSDLICRIAGLGNSTSTTSVVESKSGKFLSVGHSFPNVSLLASFVENPNCSQKAVAIGCSTGCGRRVVTSSVGPYIINGQTAARGAWPWQATVSVAGMTGAARSMCGGILIGDKWILTAAHCLSINSSSADLSDVSIQLGAVQLTNDRDAVKVGAAKVYQHPNYDPTKLLNDVGIIRLNASVSYSDTIQPICLPKPNEDLNQFKVCVSTGFGLTLRGDISSNLLQTKMDIMTDPVCAAASSNAVNTTTQMCIGSRPGIGDSNICLGDSGGPFACENQQNTWTVVGVLSTSLGTNSAGPYNTCQLSVASRVTAYLDWISHIMTL